jgi:hypothetical protein
MGEPNSLRLVLHRLAIDNRNSEMFNYGFVDGVTLERSANYSLRRARLERNSHLQSPQRYTLWNVRQPVEYNRVISL